MRQNLSCHFSFSTGFYDIIHKRNVTIDHITQKPFAASLKFDSVNIINDATNQMIHSIMKTKVGIRLYDNKGITFGNSLKKKGTMICPVRVCEIQCTQCDRIIWGKRYRTPRRESPIISKYAAVFTFIRHIQPPRNSATSHRF